MKRSLIVCSVLIIFAFFACLVAEQPDAKATEPVYMATMTSANEERTLVSAYSDKFEEAEEQDAPLHTMHYKESDIVMLAKLMYQECGGVASDTEKACVAWTVLNRVDESGETISGVITAPNQFAYYENRPVENALYSLAEDVLTRWNNEKNGEENVGRVLPRDYLWFSGDGKHNHFRNAYKGQFSIWDYSLETPYES